MKNNIFYFLLLIALVFDGCEKQQAIDNSYPTVVSLIPNINSSVPLEYLYKGEVLPFSSAWLLDITGESEELVVREQESKKVIVTKEIFASPASQTLSIYYDGTNVYDQALRYDVNAYSLSGTLEFVMDDKVLLTGSTKIKSTLTIYLNEGETKTLSVRKQGETDPLLTQTIDVNSTETLSFFFDGSALIDQIPELAPPSSPENMAIQAQFNPDFTGTATFSGDAEVDLKFYIRSSATNNSGTVTDPGIRVTVPTDGSFFNIELPPLPDATSVYTFDICKKGTDEMPYTNFAGTTYTPARSQGLYGALNFGSANSPRYFEAGASKLVLLGPKGTIKSSVPRTRYVHGNVIQDLTEYFPAPTEEDTPDGEDNGSDEGAGETGAMKKAQAPTKRP